MAYLLWGRVIGRLLSSTDALGQDADEATLEAILAIGEEGRALTERVIAMPPPVRRLLLLAWLKAEAFPVHVSDEEAERLSGSLVAAAKREMQDACLGRDR